MALPDCPFNFVSRPWASCYCVAGAAEVAGRTGRPRPGRRRSCAATCAASIVEVVVAIHTSASFACDSAHSLLSFAFSAGGIVQF